MSAPEPACGERRSGAHNDRRRLPRAAVMGTGAGMPGRSQLDRWADAARLARAIALAGAVFGALLASAGIVRSQMMMDHLDMSSPEMTMAAMSREEVARRLAGGRGDFTATRLNGLDLSGLDFTGVTFRSARLNKANLADTVARGAIFDQAWMTGANLARAKLQGASFFQAQLIGAVLDDADLSTARLPANLTKASLKRAKLTGADLSADMRNQSMGLIGSVLRSANLEGADLTGAKLSRADLEFASLRNANLSGADFSRAKLGGADLTGARVDGADFTGADLDSAKLIGLSGAESARLDSAVNLNKAVRQ